MNTSTPHAFALFSGGLDSILAARLIMEQGLVVRCLHFVTPFFGKPQLIPHWEKVYGLEVEAVDVGEAFVRLLRERPAHGFGKVMNPCVDCKILMMRKARELMKKWGASFLISGEVLGQRPMSQRRDTLNVIRRDAEVKESLLRPLSAQLLDPTAPEISGLVDRNKLLGIFGRGRKSQMALADQMGLKEIPTPAGGCKLAEKENSRRYWPVLTRLKEPTVEDFELSNIGRQYWFGDHWLSMGRNEADNSALERLVRPGDAILRVRDFPSPFALARQLTPWDNETLQDAASLVASYSPKGVRAAEASPDGTIAVRVQINGESTFVNVAPPPFRGASPNSSMSAKPSRRRTGPRLMSNDGKQVGGGRRPLFPERGLPPPTYLHQRLSTLIESLAAAFPCCEGFSLSGGGLCRERGKEEGARMNTAGTFSRESFP